MQKRIYGLETEYGIIDFYEYEGEGLYSEAILNEFFKDIFKNVQWTNPEGSNRFFYLNGGYIYLETSGRHPEYATPECVGIKDLIRWDKAGERIFEQALEEANQCDLAKNAPNARLRLYKNNVDVEGQNTFGCHENYLVARRVDGDYLSKHLIPFLVTRQIMCGSGCLFNESGFQISQRSRFIQSVRNQLTTGHRGILHDKEEPLAAKEDWRRFHLILGDSNMSEVSTFLKVGTTALILQMIEDRFLPEESILEIHNPVDTLHFISADPSCRQKIPILDMTAIEIQKLYLNRARDYLEHCDSVDSEWRDLVKKWDYVLNILEEDPMRLWREIDWITKKWLMESVLEKYGCDWTNFQNKTVGPDETKVFDILKIIDLEYHDISQETGLYNLLKKEGLVEQLVSEEEIGRAKTEAPPDTRANWRAGFIKLPRRDKRFEEVKCRVVDWENINMAMPSGIFSGKRGDTNPAGSPQKSYISNYFQNSDPLDCRTPDPDEIWEKLR